MVKNDKRHNQLSIFSYIAESIRKGAVSQRIYFVRTNFNTEAIGLDSKGQLALKSILWELLFLNQLNICSLLTSNSFLKKFFNSKFLKKIFGMKIIKILKADFKKFMRKFFLEIYFLLSISSEARIQLEKWSNLFLSFFYAFFRPFFEYKIFMSHLALKIESELINFAKRLFHV